VLIAPNTSIGVAVLKELAAAATKALGGAYDVQNRGRFHLSASPRCPLQQLMNLFAMHRYFLRRRNPQPHLVVMRTQDRHRDLIAH
jgi:hypothetical protein